MAISTYSELQTAIGNWLERDDLTNRIPEFISLAEAEINRDTKLRGQEQLSTATYDTGNSSRFIALPDDYLRLYGLDIKQSGQADAQYEPLHYKAPEFMWRFVRNTSGRPYYYTVRSAIELDTLADKAYTLRMFYLKRWDISSTSTNALLSQHEDVYLYGSLMHANIFIYEDDQNPRVVKYERLFHKAIEQADLLHHKTRDDAELDTAHVAAITGYNDVYEYDIIHGRY